MEDFPFFGYRFPKMTTEKTINAVEFQLKDKLKEIDVKTFEDRQYLREIYLRDKQIEPE